MAGNMCSRALAYQQTVLRRREDFLHCNCAARMPQGTVLQNFQKEKGHQEQLCTSIIAWWVGEQ